MILGGFCGDSFALVQIRNARLIVLRVVGFMMTVSVSVISVTVVVSAFLCAVLRWLFLFGFFAHIYNSFRGLQL